TGGPGTLSETAGWSHETVAPHMRASAFRVMLAGQPAIIGGWSSCTVIVNEQVAMFPATSVAMYVTLVVPIGIADSGAGPAVCVSVAPGQLPETVGGD